MGVSPMDSRASVLVPRFGNPTRERGNAVGTSLTGTGYHHQKVVHPKIDSLEAKGDDDDEFKAS
jgi:hypothetical protein